MALRFDLSLQEKSPVQGKLSPPYLKFAKCVSLCCIKLPNSTVTGRHNCLGHIKWNTSDRHLLLQKISISNTCCSFEVSTVQKN